MEVKGGAHAHGCLLTSFAVFLNCWDCVCDALVSCWDRTYCVSLVGIYEISWWSSDVPEYSGKVTQDVNSKSYKT